MIRPFRLAAFVIACHAVPLAAQEAPADTEADATLPAIALTPTLMQRLLLGEIAAQRQQPGTAADIYLDLARSTRDPRIARRAAEVAVHARQYDKALDATRLWIDIQPQDARARQALAHLLVATQRTEELAQVLQRELQSAGPAVGEVLLRLNRNLGRFNDKAAVWKIVDGLTTPYLTLAEARFARAQAAQAAGDAMRAMAEIDEAVALRPEWEMAALFKARQMPPGAATVDYLADWIKRNPTAKDMRLAYARGLVGEKRYDEARAEFRALQASFPENADIAFAIGVLALQLNDTAEAKAHLQRVVTLDSGRAETANFYLGQLAEDAGQIDEAMRHYGAVGRGEQFVAARARGARLLVSQGRMLEARTWLKQGREMSADDAPRLLLAEAHLLREQGEGEEAYGVLLRGLETHVDADELLYEAGINAERLGRLADAERHFRRLITVKPDSAQGYNALGYSLVDRNERLDEAATLIDKALSLAPDDSYILDSKGWLLYRQGRLDEALGFLRRAYAVKPEPEVAAHIGEVLWAQGKRSEAENVWREADKASPGNADLAATIKRFLP